jgi:hypothetical protein
MQLRPYQEDISTDAAKMLQWLNITYLSMQVRTGKTLTSLATAQKHGAKAVLFVTKKKAIGSIEADYIEFQPSFDIHITNFEQLHNVTFKPDLVIVDEAHSLGQYPIPSERVKDLRRICEGLPIIFLSGTPTPESYSQLFHQFFISSFSPFKEYKNFYAWAREFVILKKKYLYNREINDYSNALKQKIDDQTKHLFISYSQEDAGFEQMVDEKFITIKMKPSTYWLAEKMKKDRVHIGKQGEEILADTEVKLMNKLHQIYSGSVIAEDKTACVFDDSKANYIRDHYEGKKIAIFYKFQAEYAMLLFVFPGNLTTDPEEFRDSHDKIFVSQIQSGREGINLSTADYIIMFNIDYSAVSYWQARARMQSKERTKPAIIHWLFSEGGIEHRIYQAVSNKKNYTLSYFKKDLKYERGRLTGQDKKETGSSRLVGSEIDTDIG